MSSHLTILDIYDEDWQYFSMGNRLDISVNMDAEERYLILLPCIDDGVWFKLFLKDEDNEPNSHIELKSNNQGNIFCKNGGDKSRYGGEVTNFNMDISGICNSQEAKVIE